MLSVPLILLLELPPLAFGPALPPPAFQAPRELTCALEDLGRVPTSHPVVFSINTSKTRNSITLELPPNPRLVNSIVDPLLMLALAIGTNSHWDERTWSERNWGGVSPVLIPPQQTPRSLWHLGSRQPTWLPPVVVRRADR